MGPKPAPWQNGKKRDEAIANSGLPYGAPLYHVKVQKNLVTNAELDEIDKAMRTFLENEIGRECIEAEVEEVARHNNRIWHATQGRYYGEVKPRLDLLPGQLACGFHVSVLDPYPEGA